MEYSRKYSKTVISLIGVMALVVAITALAGFDVEKAYAAEGYEDVASSSEMSSALSVGKYGMVPI